jgi:putative membrane protein insertion efficiency factor
MKNVQHSTFNIQRSMAMRSCRRWTLNVEYWALNVPPAIFIFAIRAYQLTISPTLTFLFGPTSGCRFTPTCSQYAIEAIHAHGALAGGALAARRICKCHPWGGCGHDPVPKAEAGSEKVEEGIVWANARKI